MTNLEPVVKLLSSLGDHIKNSTLNDFLSSFEQLTSDHFPTKPWPTLQELNSIIPENTLQATIYNHYRILDYFNRLPEENPLQNPANDLLAYLRKIVRLLIKKYPTDPNSLRATKNTRISNNSPFSELYLFRLLSSIAVGFEATKPPTTDNSWELDSVIRFCGLCDASVSINTFLADFYNQRGRLFSLPPVSVYMSYISLFVKLRLYCSVGKYNEALKAIENVDIYRDSILFCPEALLFFHYYKAFALLMTGDVVRARDCLSGVLSKAKEGSEMRNKICYLLSICYYVWPMCANGEGLCREIFLRIQNNPRVAEETFRSASPVAVGVSHLENFTKLVAETGRYSAIIEISRFYSSLPTSLLASRLDIGDSEVAGVVLDYMGFVGRNRVDGWDEVSALVEGDLVLLSRKEVKFDVVKAYNDLLYKVGKVNGRINFARTLVK